MGTLKEDLARPGVRLIETHTAWVFLAEELVWKVKKPVDYGFLDYTTLEKRRSACEAEVHLNRRLSPGVYRRVVPVTLEADGRHVLEGAGPTVDFAVEMVRLPDDRRADVLLSRGELTVAHVDTIANLLSSFHGAMPTGDTIASFGLPDGILRNVRENFEQTRATIQRFLSAAEADEIEATQMRFIEARRELLEGRARGGRVRDGHGDLRLEHVYFTGPEPAVIDCIEFNERFRYADVASDLGFLSMDLARLGRVDLAERLLSSYAAASNDFELYRVIDFYEGYRAYVRGKVASILAADEGADPATRAAAESEARRYFLFALSACRAPFAHAGVIAIGGVIASGKSTWAERIALFACAPLLQSDRIRKALHGVAATEPLGGGAFSGAYSEGTTDRVYAALFDGARAVLDSGRPVVLDASFSRRAYRAAARQLAVDRGLPFTFIETRTTPELARERLARRAAGPSISDGRLEIYDDFVARFEPVSELHEDEHVVLDTALPEEANRAFIEGRLTAWRHAVR